MYVNYVHLCVHLRAKKSYHYVFLSCKLIFQVYITPNQQIIINGADKALNNNTTSDNHNPTTIVIKEECDDDVIILLSYVFSNLYISLLSFLCKGFILTYNAISNIPFPHIYIKICCEYQFCSESDYCTLIT